MGPSSRSRSPQELLAEPDQFGWYFFGPSGQLGPYSLKELKIRLMGIPNAKDDLFVWHDGMADWQKVSAIPDLRAEPPPPPLLVSSPLTRRGWSRSVIRPLMFIAAAILLYYTVPYNSVPQVSEPQPDTISEGVDGHLDGTRHDDAREFVVNLSISASAENPPVIRGKTNLPNGTVLTVHMYGEHATGCSPNCIFGYIGPTVKDGHFSTVPYEYDSSGVLHASSKKAMLGMPYTVYVGSIGPQPPEVENVIGNYGTNLRGPLASAWPGAIPGFQVQVTRLITIGVRAD